MQLLNEHTLIYLDTINKALLILIELIEFDPKVIFLLNISINRINKFWFYFSIILLNRLNIKNFRSKKIIF